MAAQGEGKKLTVAVAVALNPEHFDCGEEPPDGGITLEDGTKVGWEVAGEGYETNPKMRLTADDWQMFWLWRTCCPEEGPGYLPDAGGVMDQPAIMMDAFGAFRRATSELRKRDAHLRKG